MKIKELRYLYYVTAAYPGWEEDDELSAIVIKELCELASYDRDTAVKHIRDFFTGVITFGEAIKARYDWCVKALEIHPQIAIYKTESNMVFAIFGDLDSVYSFKVGVAPIESLRATSNLKLPMPVSTQRLIKAWLIESDLAGEMTIGLMLAEYRKHFSK